MAVYDIEQLQKYNLNTHHLSAKEKKTQERKIIEHNQGISVHEEAS